MIGPRRLNHVPTLGSRVWGLAVSDVKARDLDARVQGVRSDG